MSYHIFERWPFTSFQNLNLDWLMNAVKEAVTTAEEAAQTAGDAADTVAGFDSRITQADNTASSALQEAYQAKDAAIEAGSTAEQALSGATTAQATANTAQDAATRALDDYLNVEMVVFADNIATADKNVDDILGAYGVGKKIRFHLQDLQNSTDLVSYDFKIIPTSGSTDTHILVVFEDSLTTMAYNAIVADFAKISGAFSFSVSAVTFAGSGGSAANAVLYVAQQLTGAQMVQARANIGAGTSTVSYNESTGELTISTGLGVAVAYNVKNAVVIWGYQDENSGNAVIRKRSDNSIYTASQMATDAEAGKLILITSSTNGLYYLSAAGSIQGFSGATFFNGGTYTMTVSNTGSYTEIAVPAIPSFTSADAGKFYRVNSSGTAAGWETVTAAETTSFGP